MNSLPALLHALGTHGVRSIRFNILELAGSLRHTTPIADVSPANRATRRLPVFSISDLFNAFAVAPRRGEYVLNVDAGLFACLPAAGRSTKPIEKRAPAPKSVRRTPRLAA